jgi:hypothetical protein
MIGAVLMVTVYFAGTWIMPSFGKAVALAELPANLLQAGFGFVGGRLLFAAYTKIEELS